MFKVCPRRKPQRNSCFLLWVTEHNILSNFWVSKGPRSQNFSILAFLSILALLGGGLNQNFFRLAVIWLLLCLEWRKIMILPNGNYFQVRHWHIFDFGIYLKMKILTSSNLYIKFVTKIFFSVFWDEEFKYRIYFFPRCRPFL